MTGTGVAGVSHEQASIVVACNRPLTRKISRNLQRRMIGVVSGLMPMLPGV